MCHVRVSVLYSVYWGIGRMTTGLGGVRLGVPHPLFEVRNTSTG